MYISIVRDSENVKNLEETTSNLFEFRPENFRKWVLSLHQQCTNNAVTGWSEWHGIFEYYLWDPGVAT